MQDQYHVYPSRDRSVAKNEVLLERKEQIARELADAQAEKDRRLARQRSVDSTPEVRIALWESRHGLGLPKTPGHPLLQVIADCTELDVTQVAAEQKRRAQHRAAAAR
jgi:hypothetical protein